MYLPVLYWTWVWFSAHTWDNSQPTVTAAPKDLISSSGLPVSHHPYAVVDIYMNIKKIESCKMSKTKVKYTK